jgi:hypothetical protein
MLCSLSPKMDQKGLEAIQSLEAETGKILLAFACHDLKPSVLDEDALAKIQKVENDLNLVLVAVDA